MAKDKPKQKTNTALNGKRAATYRTAQAVYYRDKIQYIETGSQKEGGKAPSSTAGMVVPKKHESDTKRRAKY